MKKLLIGLTLLTSMSSFANTVRYSNSEGCTVEKEQRDNGVLLYVTKGDEQEVVGYGNHYSFGDFSYCAADNTDINFIRVSQGIGLIISCSGHKNGHKVTRGRVDISVMAGELSEVKIDGQVKGFFGWKQDLKINCSNLVRE